MAKLTDKFFNRVIEGKFVAEAGDELPKELPAVSGSDNGKALIVSGGKWQAGTISGGTKLYKHDIEIQTSDDFIYISCLSTSNESFANVGAYDTFDEILSILSYTNAGDDFIYIQSLTITINENLSSSISAVGHDFTNNDEYSYETNIVEITDTVTEL